MTTLYRIYGMCCECCVEHIGRNLKAISGVRAVDIDVLSRTARVDHDEGLCKTPDLVLAIQRVGCQVYEVEPVAGVREGHSYLNQRGAA